MTESIILKPTLADFRSLPDVIDGANFSVSVGGAPLLQLDTFELVTKRGVSYLRISVIVVADVEENDRLVDAHKNSIVLTMFSITGEVAYTRKFRVKRGELTGIPTLGINKQLAQFGLQLSGPATLDYTFEVERIS